MVNVNITKYLDLKRKRECALFWVYLGSNNLGISNELVGRITLCKQASTEMQWNIMLGKTNIL